MIQLPDKLAGGGEGAKTPIAAESYHQKEAPPYRCQQRLKCGLRAVQALVVCECTKTLSVCQLHETTS